MTIIDQERIRFYRAAYEHGRTAGAIEVIRSLGFVGNSHYCSVCLNEFHADFGQHKPGCTVLADLRLDADLDDELDWNSAT